MNKRASQFFKQFPDKKMEISDIKWLSYDECLEKIRPYSKERIKIAKDLIL